MILPTKIVKPVDSLYCMSAYAIEQLKSNGSMDFDDLLDELNNVYPKKITIEKMQQCLDFLFIIGKLELENETIKAIF
jgi:threonyl-tRNA synthetase